MPSTARGTPTKPSSQSLGKAIDPTWELGGLEAAHTFIGQPAQDAYTAFKVEQTRLSVAYGRYQDAPTLVEMIRKDYTIAVHNATAALKSAEFNRDQTQAQVDKVRSGALARYGITEPEASPPSARLEEQQAVVDAAMAALLTVSENAGTKRDAGLAALETLRPGVTTGENVQPEQDTGVPTQRSRVMAIREALSTYEGPLTRRGFAKVKFFRLHCADRTVTRTEIREQTMVLRDIKRSGGEQ